MLIITIELRNKTVISFITFFLGYLLSLSALETSGLMFGELTDQSVIVQLRVHEGVQGDGHSLGKEADLKFILKAEQSDKLVSSKEARSLARFDHIARVKFEGLQANTKYYCYTEINKKKGPYGSFTTHAGKELSDSLKFAVVTCINYANFHGDERIDPVIYFRNNKKKLADPYSKGDKELGYPALETILKLEPDFMVSTGDTVYYDAPKHFRARHLKEMRMKWRQQFHQPRFIDLFQSIPMYYQVDDHDYRYDESDNSNQANFELTEKEFNEIHGRGADAFEPSPELAQRVLREQLPFGLHENKHVKTYRTHRLNKDVQIWLVENRFHRSPNRMEDGPNKTIWGVEQKTWLKKTLLESDAKVKLLISPSPMVGPDGAQKNDNHCNFKGYRYERNEFFDWLNKTGIIKQNFFILNGDRHWQYHAIHPSGVQEFSCGALADTNARLGVMPGDPKSTDPKGLIQQPFTSKEPTGGFLMVEYVPGLLKFIMMDEHGLINYKKEFPIKLNRKREPF